MSVFSPDEPVRPDGAALAWPPRTVAEQREAGRQQQLENTATMITAALVTTPALPRDPVRDSLASGRAALPQFPDPAEDEDVVVHAQAEQQDETAAAACRPQG